MAQKPRDKKPNEQLIQERKPPREPQQPEPKKDKKN